jgi:hypothetical protein
VRLYGVCFFSSLSEATEMLVLSLETGEENDVSHMSYQDRVPRCLKSLFHKTPQKRSIHLTRGGFGALDLIADWYRSCDRCSLSYI